MPIPKKRFLYRPTRTNCSQKLENISYCAAPFYRTSAPENQHNDGNKKISNLSNNTYTSTSLQKCQMSFKKCKLFSQTWWHDRCLPQYRWRQNLTCSLCFLLCSIEHRTVRKVEFVKLLFLNIMTLTQAIWTKPVIIVLVDNWKFKLLEWPLLVNLSGQKRKITQFYA